MRNFEVGHFEVGHFRAQGSIPGQWIGVVDNGTPLPLAAPSFSMNVTILSLLSIVTLFCML